MEMSWAKDSIVSMAEILVKEVLCKSNESICVLVRKIRSLPHPERLVACFGLFTFILLCRERTVREKSSEGWIDWISRKATEVRRKRHIKRRSRKWLKRELKFNEKPKGIVNLGNTCYMNSLLQVVSWTPQMGQQLFLSAQHIENESDVTDSITSCLMDLIDSTHSDSANGLLSTMMHFWYGEPKIDITVPNQILRKLRQLNHQFLGHHQQDSFEAFNTIIGGVEDELQEIRRRKENEAGDTCDVMTDLPVTMLLGGMFMTVYRYQTCGHVETTFQRFTSISVPVPKPRLKMHENRSFQQQTESHNIMPNHRKTDDIAIETKQTIKKSKAFPSSETRDKAVYTVEAFENKQEVTTHNNERDVINNADNPSTDTIYNPLVDDDNDRISENTENQAGNSRSTEIATTIFGTHVENGVDEGIRNHLQTDNTEQVKENGDSSDDEDVYNKDKISLASSSHLINQEVADKGDRPENFPCHIESDRNEEITSEDETLSTEQNLLQMDDKDKFHATKDTDSLETPSSDDFIKQISEVEYINTLDSSMDKASFAVLSTDRLSDHSTESNEEDIRNEDSRNSVSGDQATNDDYRHSDDEEAEYEFKNDLTSLERGLHGQGEEYDNRRTEESNASAADVTVPKIEIADIDGHNKAGEQQLSKLKTEVEFVNNFNPGSYSPSIAIAHTNQDGESDDIADTEWVEENSGHESREIEQAEARTECGVSAVEDDVRSPENGDSNPIEQAKSTTEPSVNAFEDRVDSENSNSYVMDLVVSAYMKKNIKTSHDLHENNYTQSNYREQAEMSEPATLNAVDDDVKSSDNRNCNLTEQDKSEPGVSTLEDGVNVSENSNSCPIDPFLSEYTKKQQHDIEEDGQEQEESPANSFVENQEQNPVDEKENCQPNIAPDDCTELDSCFMTLQTSREECATDLECGLMELTDTEQFEEEILGCRICNTEGHKKTQKKLSVISVPPVLVLQINKFKQEYGELRKMDQDVTYPKYLNLSTICSMAMKVKDLGSSISDDGVWYHLYGVVSHAGTLKNGHYTAYVRTTQQPQKLYESFLSKKWTNPEHCRESIENFLKEKVSPVEQTKTFLTDGADTWYHISDTLVSQCKEEQALKDRNAAILLYERIV